VPQTTPICTFCAAIHSFATGEPRDFKFGTLIYHSKSYPADEISSLKGRGHGQGQNLRLSTNNRLYLENGKDRRMVCIKVE